MRRLYLTALIVSLLSVLAGCAPQPRSPLARPEQSPLSSPHPPAQLDRAALSALRQELAGAIPEHLAGGHLDRAWGPGDPASMADPYRDSQATVDALAALALGAPAVPQDELVASAVTGFKVLDGPEGSAGLLMARLDPRPAVAQDACPPQPGAPALLHCLRRQVSDGLLRAWYADDSKSFLHVGDASTVYRPVDAFAVGADLVIEGYSEVDNQKIDAGQAIIQREMKSDFDPQYGLAYGLMTATAAGSRQPTDFNAHPADQAGIALVLMRAFEASRDAVFRDDAASVLQALMDERITLTDRGYFDSVDVRSSEPASRAVDVEAGLLVLASARAYDRNDGNRFAPLEETAAQQVLASACRANLYCAGKAGAATPGGLPARIDGATLSARSGLVTALGVTALDEVLQSP